jgi:hypothetical protein
MKTVSRPFARPTPTRSATIRPSALVSTYIGAVIVLTWKFW